MTVNKINSVEPKYISNRGHKISNGYLFHNKMEPMKLLHPFLGLRGYKMNGSYFSKVDRLAKFYLYFIVTCTIIMFFAKTKIRLEIKSSPLRVIARELMLLAGLTSVIVNWISNTNSTPLLKQYNNYNYIENLLPKFNSFVHNSNHLNLFLHLSQVLIVLVIQLLNFHIYHLTTSADYIFYYWTEFVSLTMDMLSFQPCIMVNLLSSYVNALNVVLCETYGRPEYHYENRDAFMFLVKNKILRYSDTYFNRPRNFQCKRLEVDAMMNIFDKLMDNLEMITHKYNVIVSN